jgi:hypothetical protein
MELGWHSEQNGSTQAQFASSYWTNRTDWAHVVDQMTHEWHSAIRNAVNIPWILCMFSGMQRVRILPREGLSYYG